MLAVMDADPVVQSPESEPHRVVVWGHEWARDALLLAARSGSPGQAYLLAGPPAIGKGTLARLFAQALLCPAEPALGRPCGRCRSCRLVASGGHPDLHWREPQLRIDVVRELQRELALAPGESARRVAVLPDIETASLGAANSLLKTLEEPPRHAVLVLTAGDSQAVLATVRSRCRCLSLQPMMVEAVAAALVSGWGVPEDRAQLLARLSGGRLGWAARAVADETVLTERQTWLDGLAGLLGAGVAARLRLAAELARAEAVVEGLSVWMSWWRDLLLVLHGVEVSVVNRDRLEELRAAAGHHEAADVVASLRAIEDALRRLAANTSPQLTLEALFLELPS